MTTLTARALMKPPAGPGRIARASSLRHGRRFRGRISVPFRPRSGYVQLWEQSFVEQAARLQTPQASRLRYGLHTPGRDIVKRITRRDFHKTSAAAGLAATALSAERVPGANERVRLGFVGLGNRGDQVLDAFLQHKDAEVVALCDLYQPYVDFAAT